MLLARAPHLSPTFGDPTVMMAIYTVPLSLAVILTGGLPLGSSKRCLSATIAARSV